MPVVQIVESVLYYSHLDIFTARTKVIKEGSVNVSTNGWNNISLTVKVSILLRWEWNK